MEKKRKEEKGQKMIMSAFPNSHSCARKAKKKKNKGGLCQQCQNMWMKKQRQTNRQNSTKNGVS